MTTELRRPDEELLRRLQASRKHWESEGRGGAPLVMPGADLSRLDLREQILAGAQLQGADLRGSLLDSALLIRAALDGARLAGASLYSTDVSRATLAETELTGIQAPRSRWRRALLTKADLRSARLDDGDLAGADLIRARLDRASLVRANLAQALLLGASFRGADVTGASLQGAAADSQTFSGAIGTPVGEPRVAFQTTPRRRSSSEREFETAVQEFLRERRLQVMGGFDPGPDLVVELRGDAFAAVEVSTSADRNRLFRLAERADLIVVPDDLGVRSAMNDTPVSRLRDSENAIYSLEPSELKSYGASAVAIRAADRLRPYLILAQYVRTDPSFASRLFVHLDTRQVSMLSAADRSIAEQLPAHLDGRTALNAISWVETYIGEVRHLLTKAASIRRGADISTQAATELARLGLRLERELAAGMKPER